MYESTGDPIHEWVSLSLVEQPSKEFLAFGGKRLPRGEALDQSDANVQGGVIQGTTDDVVASPITLESPFALPAESVGGFMIIRGVTHTIRAKPTFDLRVRAALRALHDFLRERGRKRDPATWTPRRCRGIRRFRGDIHDQARLESAGREWFDGA